jgi:hypothetical protein
LAEGGLFGWGGWPGGCGLPSDFWVSATKSCGFQSKNISAIAGNFGKVEERIGGEAIDRDAGIG